MTVFNADKWLTSAFNVLMDAIKDRVDDYVPNDVDAPAGLQVYDVVIDFFPADRESEFTELEKTIIHLVLDDVQSTRLGLGPQAVAETVVDPTVDDAGTVTEQYARAHRMNFDVGIWASDQSGGSSARLEALEMLDKLFNPDSNIRFGDGVEIISFNGGRFVTDTLNDIRVFRVIGAELIVRVYSRDLGTPDIIVDEEPSQNPDLEIDGTPLTN